MIEPTTQRIGINVFTNCRTIFIFSAFCFLFSGGLYAQSNNDPVNDVVYKFSVENVTNANEAEQVLIFLNNQEYSTGIKFIDECDCFKMSVRTEVSYETIRSGLLSLGNIISEDIYKSTGEILTKQNLLKD